MRYDVGDLPPEVLDFLTVRHLATLTLVRPDGRPQVTPVGITWDNQAHLVRVITWEGAVKAKLLRASEHLAAAVCQVDGGRWLTLEGSARLTDEPGRVDEAVRRYTARYRAPKQRPDRVAIEIEVRSVNGRVPTPD